MLLAGPEGGAFGCCKISFSWGGRMINHFKPVHSDLNNQLMAVIQKRSYFVHSKGVDLLIQASLQAHGLRTEIYFKHSRQMEALERAM